VYSTDTEEQAKRLIVATCVMGQDGKYYARELLQEQTLENLGRFSDKLARVDKMVGGVSPAPKTPI
jgi:hypothetical protein